MAFNGTQMRSSKMRGLQRNRCHHSAGVPNGRRQAEARASFLTSEERLGPPSRAPVHMDRAAYCVASRYIGLIANFILASSLMWASSAAAQQAAPPAEKPAAFIFARIPAPPEPRAIALYPKSAELHARLGTEVWDRMPNGQRVVRNVTRPTLTPFLPDPAKATGAAVIVAPGGAFKMLSMDGEGWPVAKWLADHGVAAFVLKYRLNATPEDEPGFVREMGALLASRDTGQGPALEEPRATADALAALKMVRSNSAQWKIDPARVGMIGFSSGAMTALNAAMAPDGRPAFIGYIYGPMTPISVSSDAPPLFAALALDDNPFGRQGFGIIESWHKAGRPVELHAYEKGDHGFGMGKPGTTTMLLMDEFLLWMEARGLFQK